MKKGMMFVIVVIAILVVVGAIALFSNTYQAPNNTGNQATNNAPSVTGTTYQVKIMGMAFSPTPIKINAGDTVVWTNQDSVSHTVTSDSGSELSSPTLSTGDTYSHTFTTAGTYPYHCSIHTYMKGTVVVQ